MPRPTIFICRRTREEVQANVTKQPQGSITTHLSKEAVPKPYLYITLSHIIYLEGGVFLG